MRSPGLLLSSLLVFCPAIPAQQIKWQFAVSGDSRNCGDIVMPAIAKFVKADNAQFYWHLGDFRAIFIVDQDYQQTHKPSDPIMGEGITDYLSNAWPDFIQSQLKPFDPIPVFLAFGNHELIPPKTRDQLILQFADWLDTPVIREQRLRDNPQDHAVKGYYHWIKDGIDFITLDNASPDEFDDAQLKWVKSLLARDAGSTEIRAVVAGMHEALPDSISESHSMAQSLIGTQSGRQVYSWLLNFKKTADKPVYVLASHSHFYMEGIFNTPYWKANGGVLPGWIIGTAGAQRYKLPDAKTDAIASKTNVYGYLLASVTDSKTEPIHFTFHELSESDVPADIVTRYSGAAVHECWVGNHQ